MMKVMVLIVWSEGSLESALPVPQCNFFLKCTRRTLSPLFQIINKEAKPAKVSTKYLLKNLEAPLKERDVNNV